MTFDQFGSLILLAMGAIAAVGFLIDGYGGWPILWDDLKRRFLHRKEH